MPLIEDRFRPLYQRLLVADIRQQLRSFFPSNGDAIPDADLRYLFSVASQLALSDEAEDQATAYEIATRIPQLVSDPSYAMAGQVILARLGNFPGRDLLRQRAPKNGHAGNLPPFLALECAARQVENTAKVIDRQPAILTDFQMRLFETLERHRAVSVSAPTSAGKSFVLSLDIIRRFKRPNPPIVVYLVPTRALIRQVMRTVIRQLNAAGFAKVPVWCVPQSSTDRERTTGMVYVLTQERLSSLLYTAEGEPHVDLLVVDEAQGISEDTRGIVLQASIDETLTRFPAAEVFFSSPLAANPGFLLSLFHRNDDGEYFLERLSPVSQNVLLVSAVKREALRAKVELFAGDQAPWPVGDVELPFEFRGGLRLARLATAFTREGETSIVYANIPRSAEKAASEIAEQRSEPEVIDSEIIDLIEFLKTHIHPQYLLIDYLRKQVAFHYGKMPEVVRARIEDLLRERKLRFVCCTSTLLQGINLPAKNIFIENPKTGRGRPMSKGTFWNLAGRAGRLAEEFHGNVWCVCKEEWDQDPLKGVRLEEINSAFARALADNYTQIVEVMNNRDASSERAGTGLADHAFGQLFATYTLSGRELARSEMATEENREPLAALDRLGATVLAKVTLPKSVFTRNSSISPWRLEALATYFAKQQYILPFIPQSPYSPDGHRRMKRIFGVLEEIFFQTGNKRWEYLCGLAYHWIAGKTLKELIANKIEHDKVPNDPKHVSDAIRKLLEDLEDEVRYKYVKYLRAYNDVLAAYLTRIGRQNLQEGMTPLHLLIEYGAADEVLINLMALGLSRPTAILVKRAAKFASNASREECLRVLNELDLAKLDIPAVCRREVEELRRR